MRVVKLVVVVLFAALAVVSCGGAGTNNASSNAVTPVTANGNGNGSASTVTAGADLDGKQLFTENCQICHRNTGTGGPVTVQGKKLKPADLTGDRIRKRTDDDIAKGISEGSPDDGMPAFRDKLKPDEIKAIVAYVRTLQQQ